MPRNDSLFIFFVEKLGVGAAAGTGAAAATGKKPADVESEAILTWVATAPPSGSVVQGEDRRQHSNHYDDDDRRYGRRSYDRDAEDDYDGRGPAEFFERERRVI